MQGQVRMWTSRVRAYPLDASLRPGVSYFLFTGREVDLVDLSVVKEPLRRCIEEGVLLYEAE